MSDFLDPSEEIDKHGRRLPHWQQDGIMQFVTLRLCDSLPTSKLSEWQGNRKTFLEQNPKPWTPEKEFPYHRRFTQRFEEYLDEGAGSCILWKAVLPGGSRTRACLIDHEVNLSRKKPPGRTALHTLIHDPKHFANCVRYIRRNPKHLPNDAFTLWESDRAKKL